MVRIPQVDEPLDERDQGLMESVIAFKTIHVLNDVLKSKRENGKPVLKATHFCCPLVNGRNPMWAIWTVSGNFVRYAGNRDTITRAYPGKAWTRTMASWALTGRSEYRDIKKRVMAIEQHFHRISGRLED
jgi:hypothetical protein